MQSLMIYYRVLIQESTGHTGGFLFSQENLLDPWVRYEGRSIYNSNRHSGRIMYNNRRNCRIIKSAAVFLSGNDSSKSEYYILWLAGRQAPC